MLRVKFLAEQFTHWRIYHQMQNATDIDIAASDVVKYFGL